MGKSTNEYVAAYKAALQQGELQFAYERLVKYVMSLRSHFGAMTDYQVGNVSPGYMDFTYFPFFDDFLRKKKLRFGVVLNHQKIQFELWLMGQNAQVQKEYWELLKDTQWNRERIDMPKYSVLEAVIESAPDFDHLDRLTRSIQKDTLELTKQIMPHIQ